MVMSRAKNMCYDIMPNRLYISTRTVYSSEGTNRTKHSDNGLCSVCNAISFLAIVARNGYTYFACSAQ